ncbi:MAG: translation initiation factor eIF-2B [Thermoplasmata archaeon]
MNTNELIQEIKNNKTSGASELMIKAIKCISTFSEAFNAETIEKYHKGMVAFGRQLVDTQPSMAPLFYAVNKVLLVVENEVKRGRGLQEIKNAIKSASDELLANSKNAITKIKKQVANLIEEGCTILTHSYSSTVIQSLIFAHQEGKGIVVIITESRPLFEGRRTAGILAENGIRAVLIADMASFHFLDDVDIILTGSDCICHNGVVNKIGTKGIAIAASQYGIPFYVLSEKSKFLPSKYMDEPLIEEKEGREILEDAGDTEVKNIYFDITPHRFYKGVITEDGEVEGNEVQAILAQLEVCKGLIGK